MNRQLSVMVGAGVVLVASSVWAADMTGASVALDSVGASSSAWAARILLIGFISAIGWLALSRMFGLASIVAVPITFIIIGGLLLAGPTILGGFMAAGATLPPVPVVGIP